MSNPRYYWHDSICKILRRYPVKLKTDGTPRSKEYIEAIEEALAETADKPYDGKERVRFLDMLYFRNTRTLNGAALECNISIRTAKKWSHDFVYLVAEKLGLL